MILYETDTLWLVNEFECAYLYEKSSGKILMCAEIYGDPNCGLISKNGDWAIIAGEYILLWINGTVTKIENEELKWIHSIRVKEDYLVEILIDPWGNNSSIWELNLKTLNASKRRDFIEYRGREYCEDVVW